MPVTTRLMLGAAALVFLVGGIVSGMMPKQIHIAECGSPFFPAKTASMNSEAAYECTFALDKRYTLLWVLFIGGGTLGLAATFGVQLFSTTPSKEPAGH